MSTVLRVPARVVEYMDGTGWGSRAEAVDDEPRLELLRLMRGRRRITLRDPGEAMLGRLWFEADHLADSWRFGDHDPDTYADYRAATRLMDAIAAIDPTVGPRCRDIMYG
jgi:hypothetical protein